MSILEIENIAKSFDNNQVIADMSFSVSDGEFVSIVGPSGSGKSTLFQMIGGMLMPDVGSILMDGDNINGRAGSISYTPQSPSLFPWRTILKNVLLGMELLGEKDEDKALAMIKRSGLAGYENRYPHELSGGMKQRVSFIRSMLSPQEFMCLDEPFSALDEFTRIDMQKWLLSMWQKDQRSILFVTHNIEEAIFLSDRIIVLSQKPTRVKKEFVIPFARPRREEMLLSEKFLQLKRDIYYELRDIDGENNHRHTHTS